MRRPLAVFAVAVVAAGLAGCGGGDDESDAGASGTTTTSASTTTSQSSTTTSTTRPPSVPATTTTTTEVPVGGGDAASAVEEYVTLTLGWGDGVVQGTAVQNAFTVTSPTYGTAEVSMDEDPDSGAWFVSALWTFGDEEIPASVRLGFDEGDYVAMDYRDDALYPQYSMAYGDGLSVSDTGAPGDEAYWEPRLLTEEDTAERYLTILWYDAGGVVREGWSTVIPAGEFAAG